MIGGASSFFFSGGSFLVIRGRGRFFNFFRRESSGEEKVPASKESGDDAVFAETVPVLEGQKEEEEEVDGETRTFESTLALDLVV